MRSFSHHLTTLKASVFTFLICTHIICDNVSKAQGLFPSPSGPIQDVSCNVEQVELANDSQLHLILQELQNTTFFRTFAVDLDHGCPLTAWSKKKSKEGTKLIDMGRSSSESESKEEEQTEETAECASSGLPDFEDYEGGACGVEAGDGFLGMTKSTLFSTPKSLPSAPPNIPEAAASDDEESDSDDDDDDDEDDEFECNSSEELDDDAPPLCEVGEEDMPPRTPVRDLFSSALKSISEAVGWESESQRRTFSWQKPSNPVVVSGTDDGPCDEDEMLPDTFWMDMCSEITSGEGLKIVNLALNPERNTGYNGTHIWKTIYEENCIAVDGTVSEPMCYEERVLYRLLSGLHTSTTLSIAKNYYPPSKRKGRENWEPNPQYFMRKFEKHPEHINNLHFSYVVLLRALRKASPFLYNYEIYTGNIVDDETATILLKRLLDTHILRSCSSVFSAFDESHMFKSDDAKREVVSIRENFKGVFHNISSILDCVQCQQCKLHGKMSMLGYGTALKILFLPEELIPTSLDRNEIVAFINTIAKFSESMKEIREMTHLYWEQTQKQALPSRSPSMGIPTTNADNFSFGNKKIDLEDDAVAIISKLARAGKISEEREVELIRLALEKNSDLLILVKHYASDLEKFLLLSQNIENVSNVISDDEPDAIIVGTGLAGMAAALNILDRGGKIIMVEKEHRLGGNSAKASSGINACCPHNSTYGDELEVFKNDTIKSAGDAAQLPLIETLVSNSAGAVQWLKNRAGVDLSLLAQLGGHSHKRTHRPNNGMVGAEVVYAMQKNVKEYEKKGMAQILVDTKVTKLVQEKGGRVVGVEYQSMKDGQTGTLSSPNIVLATGGFAADRSVGSFLSQYRPELLKMPATAGEFSTGDGIKLATALGAGTVDMDKVQVHPTGWVDPSDPTNPNKILAAEMMRGVGGILLNSSGKRFCNELGTRAYVTDMMLGHDPYYAETKQWNSTNEIPTFSLVLSSSAALDGRKHVDLYTHKGLLKKLEGVNALADWMGFDVEVVKTSLRQYQNDAANGIDEWGKTSFRGVPDTDLENEVFYAGKVTPVLHYCMGGVTIDTEGNVLDENRTTIPGLHAAGEIAGGVHGNNRLGGNSLLECTVFGTIIGKKIPIKDRTISHGKKETVNTSNRRVENQNRDISADELSRHNTPEDCWVAIRGTVYNFTEFAEEHPPGAESIFKLGGLDGTEAFEAVHNTGLLEDFDDVKVGVLVSSN